MHFHDIVRVLLFLYNLAMKKKFYDEIVKSEYLKRFPLVDLAMIGMEMARLGMIKEDYCDYEQLVEHALYGGESER